MRWEWKWGVTVAGGESKKVGAGADVVFLR